MYPSSSSSSSQSQSQSQSHNSTISETGLTRYGSAPGSLLRTAVDAVIGGSRPLGVGVEVGVGVGVGVGAPYFSVESSESNCKVNNNSSPSDPKEQRGGLQRSYGLQEAFGGSSSSALLRQRSSPAGFLSNLATSALPHDIAGFTITRGSGSYSSNSGHGVGRLKSQMSFTGQDSLSQISEVNENVVDASTSEHRSSTMHGHGFGSPSSSSTFAIDPCWDNSNSNSIVFSAPPSKRSKHIDGDILNCLNALDSQFSMPQTTLEMVTMEKLMHIPEDSIPCKIRAKRGCATHPRSIAERERRTRISGKLKKLQELVPNMDKQTSYADMLDLAVQHIKGLQSQVQKLHKELENCTCGCKPST